MKKTSLDAKTPQHAEASLAFWQIVFVLGLGIGIGLGSFFIGRSVGDFVVSIIAGDGILVDNTNPKHPIVSAIGGGGGECNCTGNLFTRDFTVTAAAMSGLSSMILWTPDQHVLITYMIPLTGSINFDAGGFVTYGLTDVVSNAYGGLAMFAFHPDDLKSFPSTWVDELNFFPQNLNLAAPFLISPTNPFTFQTFGGPSDYTTGVWNFRIFYQQLGVGAGSPSGVITRRFSISAVNYNSGEPIILFNFTQREVFVGYNIIPSECEDIIGSDGSNDLVFGPASTNNLNAVFPFCAVNTGNGLVGNNPDEKDVYTSSVNTRTTSFTFSPDTPLVTIDVNGADTITSGVIVIDVMTELY
jgi:hypothetical protein